MKIVRKLAALSIVLLAAAFPALASNAGTIRYRVTADASVRKVSIACLESSTNECVFRIGDLKAGSSETVHVNTGEDVTLPESDFELQYCADIAEGDRSAWPGCASGPTAGSLGRSTTVRYRFF